MKEGTVERALLEYFSRFPDSQSRYRSLSTVFETFIFNEDEKSVLYDELRKKRIEGDSKENLRNILEFLDGESLLESKMDDRGYERCYCLSESGLAEVDLKKRENFSLSKLSKDDHRGGVNKQVTIDSAAWTGLTKTIIDARRARVISGLIDDSLSSISELCQNNFEAMQAAAYLKAAKELADAPDPPSELIWQLIGRAADIVGLVGIFLAIFAQAAH